MRTVWRLIAWTLATLVVVVGGALAAFHFAPSGWISVRLASAFEAQTGRALTIDGPIERSLYPQLRLAFGPARIANADWATDDAPLLAAERVEIALDAAALWDGRFDVRVLRLEGAAAVLEVAEDGRRNYIFTPPIDAMTAPTPGPRAPAGEGMAGYVQRTLLEALDGEDGVRPITIEEAVIRDGVVNYVNNANGQSIFGAKIDGVLTLPSYDQPLTLMGAAEVNGRPVTLSAAIDNLAAYRRGERIAAVLDIDGAGVALDFDGSATVPHIAGARSDAPPEAEGLLVFGLSDDRRETAWLRRALPESLTPLEGVGLSGEFSVSADQLTAALAGYAGFGGRETEVSLAADAGAGWFDGAATADIAFSARNDLADAGFDGGVRADAGGRVSYLSGAYRLKAADVGALAEWALPEYREAAARGASARRAPLLEAVDIAGEAQFDDAAAAAALAGALRYNGRPVAVDGEAMGGADWRSGGVVETRLSLEETADGLARMDWNGALELLESGPRLVGDLAAATPDAQAAREWLGAVDAGFGLGPDYGAIMLAAHIDADRARLLIEDGAVQTETTRTDLAIEATWTAPRPFVDAEISGGPFDLTPFVFPDGDGAAAPPAVPRPGAPAWSTAPLDFAPLLSADGRFRADLAGFQLGDFEVGRIVADGALTGGRLDAELREAAVYGGGVTAQLTAIALDRAGRLEGSAEADGVALGRFLAGIGFDDVMNGDAEGSVRLSTEGRSLNDFMTGLAGDAFLAVNGGTLFLVDFEELSIEFGASIFGAVQETPGVTPFDALTASAVLEAGVARNEDLSFEGPVISFRGEGEIDIGQRGVDYVATPTRFGEASILGIDRAIGAAFPVAIRGAWAAPIVGLDDRPTRGSRARTARLDR